MILSISSFEIINVAISDPKMLFWITATVADAAAVNTNGIKTLLADGLSTFFNKGKPAFSNSSTSLPKNPLIVLFYAIKLLIILHQVMNYLQRLYEALKLVH